MNPLALVVAGLLALTTPLAWTAAPHAADAPTHAIPAGPSTPEAAQAVPEADEAAAKGTLRVRIVNEGAAATVLLSLTDASGVPRHELRTVAARTTATFDYGVPLGKATSEVRAGLVGGASTSDLSACASRLVEHNHTLSASLTGGRISVGSWCVAASA